MQTVLSSMVVHLAHLLIQDLVQSSVQQYGSGKVLLALDLFVEMYCLMTVSSGFRLPTLLLPSFMLLLLLMSKELSQSDAQDSLITKLHQLSLLKQSAVLHL